MKIIFKQEPRINTKEVSVLGPILVRRVVYHVTLVFKLNPNIICGIMENFFSLGRLEIEKNMMIPLQPDMVDRRHQS